MCRCFALFLTSSGSDWKRLGNIHTSSPLTKTLWFFGKTTAWTFKGLFSPIWGLGGAKLGSDKDSLFKMQFSRRLGFFNPRLGNQSRDSWIRRDQPANGWRFVRDFCVLKETVIGLCSVWRVSEFRGGFRGDWAGLLQNGVVCGDGGLSARLAKVLAFLLEHALHSMKMNVCLPFVDLTPWWFP